MAAEEEEIAPSGVRSFWSGTLTFGLVSVPVNLFPATVKRRVAFKMVSVEGAPVKRRYVCSKDEQDLDPDDIVRGYEIEKGKFVLVTDDELEAIEPRKSREIDLRLFVEREEIDPMYFERGYFLTPAGGSNKAYRLLAEVMERSGRAGIATFVMRAKEYLVAIMAENGILRVETLRFADELRKPTDVGLPKKTAPKAAEVKKFEQLIAKKSRKLDLSLMLDDYATRVEARAAEKRKSGDDIVRLKAEAASDEEEGSNVVDIMEVLRRSLGQSRVRPKSAGKTKAATTGTKAKSKPKAASTKAGASKKKAPSKSSSAKRAPSKKAASKKSTARKKAN